LIYGLGGLVSRILAVVLLPLYTRYLSPSDYGIVETLIALTTVIGIVLALGIGSAFFRFYFDAEDEPGHRARDEHAPGPPGEDGEGGVDAEGPEQGGEGRVVQGVSGLEE